MHRAQNAGPPLGERRFVPREVVIGLASNLSASAFAISSRACLAARSSAAEMVGAAHQHWRVNATKVVGN
jgi:hypothetical protein